MKPIKEVKTAEEAREIAIDWQMQGQNGLGERVFWSDLAEAGSYFEALAKKFPELEEEFKENGII